MTKRRATQFDLSKPQDMRKILAQQQCTKDLIDNMSAKDPGYLAQLVELALAINHATEQRLVAGDTLETAQAKQACPYTVCMTERDATYVSRLVLYGLNAIAIENTAMLEADE